MKLGDSKAIFTLLFLVPYVGVIGCPSKEPDRRKGRDATDSQGVAVGEAEMLFRISGLFYQTRFGLSVPRCDMGLEISYCLTRLMVLHGKGSDQICWGRRSLESESCGSHIDICGWESMA